MTTDLTFITNEPGKKLLDRFTALIKDTRFFDCLVGYFYTSGFYSIYKSLENTEKIRILIGISTDKETFDLIQESRKEQGVLQTISKSIEENKPISEYIKTNEFKQALKIFIQKCLKLDLIEEME